MDVVIVGRGRRIRNPGVSPWRGAQTLSQPLFKKKKGEDLAIHEDIEKLVEQVKAVTQATKEIETKISGELWERQKHWAMKREAMFEMSKKLSGVDHALTSMHSTHEYYRTLIQSRQLVDASAKAEASAKASVHWGKAADG